MSEALLAAVCALDPDAVPSARERGMVRNQVPPSEVRIRITGPKKWEVPVNDIQEFSFQGFSDGRPFNLRVRVILRNGEPWWVLRDVTDALGLSNSRKVSFRIETDDVTQSYIIDSMGRQQLMTVINEAGLYTAILRSDKPEARNFKRWITHEVLPSIRKTGGYAMSDRELMARAVLEAQRVLAEKDREISQLAPDALVARRISNAEGLKTLSEIGKINGLGPHRIFFLLEEKRILYRSRGAWVPYQEHVDAGRFVVRERTFRDGEEVDHLVSQTYVTGKGEVWLAKQFFPVPQELPL